MKNIKITFSLLLISLAILTQSPVQAALKMDVYAGVGGIAGVETATANASPDASSEVSVLHHFDDVNGAGHYGKGFLFPGGFTDNFGIHVTGYIDVTTAGLYTFGTYTDDGVRLQIDGNTLITLNGYAPATDSYGTITLAPGFHSLALIYYEGGGGAILELFAKLTPAGQEQWNAGFALVGDTENGGLKTSISAVPIPAAAGLFFSAIMPLGWLGWGRKQNKA